MLRTSLLGTSSIVRCLLFANTSTNASTKLPQIKVALCIQRYPHLSPKMNQLEKDYTDLLRQLEDESSYLSDHELRHKRELWVEEIIRWIMIDLICLGKLLNNDKVQRQVQQQQ
jgi:hypothetical protein